MLFYNVKGPNAFTETVQSCLTQHSEKCLPTWRKPVSTKNTNISQAWWRTLIIPATWVAEAQEWLEPGGRGCSEPRSGHRIPVWATRVKRHPKKKKTKKNFRL